MKPLLTKVWRFGRILLSHPYEAIDRVRNRASVKVSSSCDECPDALNQAWTADEWIVDFHRKLGEDTECECYVAFTEVMSVVPALQHSVARHQHDADRGLLMAIHCIVRHHCPKTVIETGVARGLISRVVLEASKGSDSRLWSVDLPPLSDPWWSESRTAVEGKSHPRWTYIRGDAARILPRILARVGSVDLFIHDSLHTYDHMQFELNEAFHAIRRSGGGILICDDVDTNAAFSDFQNEWEHYLGASTVIRHVDKAGAFGIAVIRGDSKVEGLPRA